MGVTFTGRIVLKSSFDLAYLYCTIDIPKPASHLVSGQCRVLIISHAERQSYFVRFFCYVNVVLLPSGPELGRQCHGAFTYSGFGQQSKV